jgi:hypothetical protein
MTLPESDACASNGSRTSAPRFSAGDALDVVPANTLPITTAVIPNHLPFIVMFPPSFTVFQSLRICMAMLSGTNKKVLTEI